VEYLDVNEENNSLVSALVPRHWEKDREKRETKRKRKKKKGKKKKSHHLPVFVVVWSKTVTAKTFLCHKLPHSGVHIEIEPFTFLACDSATCAETLLCMSGRQLRKQRTSRLSRSPSSGLWRGSSPSRTTTSPPEHLPGTVQTVHTYLPGLTGTVHIYLPGTVLYSTTSISQVLQHFLEYCTVRHVKAIRCTNTK